MEFNIRGRTRRGMRGLGKRMGKVEEIEDRGYI